MNPTITRSISLLLILALITACLAGTALAADTSFADVAGHAYYADAVSWAVDNHITAGTSKTTFSPNDTCTRGQIVAFLYRAAGAPPVSGENPFLDVAKDSYYFQAVLWAVTNGITAGTSPTTFAPEAPCTRAQAMTFLYRAAACPVLTARAGFSDVFPSDYYYNAISWGVENGITAGEAEDIFSPAKYCTRAQIVTFLYREATAPLTVGTLPSADQVHFISLAGASTDATLVESNGLYMLVDAGNPDDIVGGNYAFSNSAQNGQAVVDYLHALGITHLDYLIMTHNHSDHIGGVPVLCRGGLVDRNTTVYYRAACATREETTTDWQNLWYLQQAVEAVSACDAEVICLADQNITELTLHLGDYSIEFRNLDEDKDGVTDIYTGNENQNSLVLKVTKGTVDILLTADLQGREERILLANGGLSDIDIMKLGHHGNATSNTYEWLTTTSPAVTVLTKQRFDTAETGGTAQWAYLQSKNIPVYACDSTKKAVVFTIEDESFAVSQVDDQYALTSAVQHTQSFSDGFYYWNRSHTAVNNTVCIENGALVKDDDRTDCYSRTYHFNSDGIGTETEQE